MSERWIPCADSVDIDAEGKLGGIVQVLYNEDLDTAVGLITRDENYRYRAYNLREVGSGPHLALMVHQVEFRNEGPPADLRNDGPPADLAAELMVAHAASRGFVTYPRRSGRTLRGVTMAEAKALSETLALLDRPSGRRYIGDDVGAQVARWQRLAEIGLVRKECNLVNGQTWVELTDDGRSFLELRQ